MILGGAGRAARTGAVAGLPLRFGPWVRILGARVPLGGGWSLPHWAVNQTAYAALGAPVGWLRRWTGLGHRFGTIPLAGWRAGWHTWLGLAAIDVLVIVFVAENGLGGLLLVGLFGLLWLRVLYDRVWSAMQDARMRREGPRGQGADVLRGRGPEKRQGCLPASSGAAASPKVAAAACATNASFTTAMRGGNPGHAATHSGRSPRANVRYRRPPGRRTARSPRQALRRAPPQPRRVRTGSPRSRTRRPPADLSANSTRPGLCWERTAG